MSRRSNMGEIRLPNHEEPISAVTILDGEGRVVRVVPGNEFRRGPKVRRQFATRGRGERGEPSAATKAPGHSLLASGRPGTEPLLKG
jgi:hypothetical protein